MSVQPGVTHIIGAGLAGLSAATLLAGQGRRVMLYEAAPQAGGRCRSYYDSTLHTVIDNGTHLLLSGNKAAMSYLERIGSHVENGTKAVFQFIDMQSGTKQKLRLSHLMLPFILLPGYRLLWHMLLLAALNTNPGEASRRLIVSLLRKTLLKGENACIPLVTNGLSETFIDPALHYLATHQAIVIFNRRLRHIKRTGNEVILLGFADGFVTLRPSDRVICALPAWNMTSLLPEIHAPDHWHSIINVHFHIAPPPGFPKMLGLTHATAEWIFGFRDHICVTISHADRLMREKRETLAYRLWQEVMEATGLKASLPPWQVVKEKRATFAATPDQDAERPETETRWHNLYLAGDWVQTGLPATIEGAILSGQRAAEMVLAGQ